MRTAIEKHTDQETRKQFNKEIVLACLSGAAQGAVAATISGYLLSKKSVGFSNLRKPVKVFFYGTCIFLGVFYEAETQVRKFREKLFKIEMSKRERILDVAAEKGIFLEGE